MLGVSLAVSAPQLFNYFLFQKFTKGHFAEVLARLLLSFLLCVRPPRAFQDCLDLRRQLLIFFTLLNSFSSIYEISECLELTRAVLEFLTLSWELPQAAEHELCSGSSSNIEFLNCFVSLLFIALNSSQ